MCNFIVFPGHDLTRPQSSFVRFSYFWDQFVLNVQLSNPSHTSETNFSAFTSIFCEKCAEQQMLRSFCWCSDLWPRPHWTSPTAETSQLFPPIKLSASSVCLMKYACERSTGCGWKKMQHCALHLSCRRLAPNKRKRLSQSDGQREISPSSASGQQSPCSLISGKQLSSAQQRTSKTVFGSSRVSSLLFRLIICAVLKHRWISKQIVLKQDRSVLKPSKSTMHLHKRAVKTKILLCWQLTFSIFMVKMWDVG